MGYWYSKGQSQYTEGNFHMALYMDMNGYDEGNYDSQDIEGDGESGDPFMAFAIDTQTWAYGQAQVEIGLLGSHRIRINSSGVRIWTAGDVWKDPLTEGGGAEGEWFKTITGITNDVVADQVDDTLTLSSANNRLTIVGNSETDTINFNLVEGNINHNALANLNAGDVYEHLSAAQVTALHDKYTNAEAVAAVLAADDYLKLVGDTMGGAINMNSNNITGVNTIVTLGVANYDKFRVWTNPAYTIGLMDAMTYGGLNNYAMTFTVYHTVDRGWVWRDDDDAKNDGAMSLTTAGVLTVKGASTFQSSLQVDGNITTGGTVDGTDISAHVGNATAHQDAPDLIATHHLSTSTDHDDRYYTEAETYTQAQVNALIPSAGDLNHNDLANLNAGDNYEHITQTQKSALHAIYSLEVHDNVKHTPNYSAEGHTHDDRYYTETEADALYSILAHRHDGQTLQLDAITSDGGVFNISTSLNINFKPDADADDYISFTTVADVPYITFIGGNGKITNVVDPTDDQDVATKKSVDDHNWLEADITDLDHDAIKIQGKAIDVAALGDNKILKYDLATTSWKCEIDIGDDTIEHDRPIYPTLVVAQDAHTVGANNVYRQTAYMNHGTNSKTAGHSSYWHFTLPDDYVDGENITVVLHYIMGGETNTVNYQWLHQYYLQGAALANANTPAGAYFSDENANDLNIETSTMTGTNLVGGCHVQILFRAEDNAGAQVVKVLGIHLLVPVNTRD